MLLDQQQQNPLEQDFGGSRTPQTRAILLDVHPMPHNPHAILNLRVVGDFTRTNGGATFLPQGHVFAYSIRKQGGPLVEVDLCIDPRGVASGRYDGRIVISGAGLVNQTLPLTVKLRSDLTGLAWLAALSGALFAFVVFARARKVKATVFGTVIAVGFIAIFAAIAMTTVYFSSATFGGAGASDWFTLVIWSFTGKAAGLTIADAAMSAFH